MTTWQWNVIQTTLTVAVLIVAGWTLWATLSGGEQQRRSEAWQIVSNAGPGNSGTREALEYLNSLGMELEGLKLPPWWGEDSETGELRGEVSLKGIKLSNAKLAKGTWWGVILDDATLTGADLTDMILYRARLIRADLTGAIIRGADFRGADLTDVKGLTQEQLDTACGGDERTRLPVGLTTKPCQSPQWYL